ncbi:hypothetical protein Dimus_032457 [Dionaea muscipula]
MGPSSITLSCPPPQGRMLNWLALRHHTDYRRRTVQIVISFDLSEEAFVMTPMPPRTECKCGRKHQRCCLIQNTFDEPCTIVCFADTMNIDHDVRECTCFDNQKIIHIWTLNEYGESGSWTKLWSLAMFDYACDDDLFMLWRGGDRRSAFRDQTTQAYATVSLLQPNYSTTKASRVGLPLATQKVLYQSMREMVENSYLMIPTGRSTVSTT